MPHINSDIDFILSYGEQHLEDLIARVRNRLINALGDTYEFLDYQSLINVTRDILSDLEPLLAKVLSDAQVAAWVLGADKVVRNIPSDIVIPNTNFGSSIHGPSNEPPSSNQLFGDSGEEIELFKIDNAVKDLRSRQIVTRPKFDALSSNLKKQSFTVAYQQKEETVEKIRDVLADTIQKGPSLRNFRQAIGKAFDSSPMGVSHSDLVYRVNTMSAYASGHDTIMAHPIMQEVFPFTEYLAIDDSRVRDEHLALEHYGLLNTSGEMTAVYWTADQQFWSNFVPPWSWGCRCARSAMLLEQAVRLGIQVAIEWQQTGKRPEMVSCLPNVPFRRDPSFVGGGRVLV